MNELELNKTIKSLSNLNLKQIAEKFILIHNNLLRLQDLLGHDKRCNCFCCGPLTSLEKMLKGE